MDSLTAAIFWLLFSIVTGIIGSTRTIGGGGAFLISVFFSPIVGLLLAFDSRKKSKIAFEQATLENNKKIIELLREALISKGGTEKAQTANVPAQNQGKTEVADKLDKLYQPDKGGDTDKNFVLTFILIAIVVVVAVVSYVYIHQR